MKTTDFLNESFVEDAAAAHQDHEVQMARSDCYNAAKYAIELHKLLKNISEQEGLDGWVSEKITLANDYLRTVTEYLRYEQQTSAQSDMPEFNIGTATQTLDSVLGEGVMPAMEEGAFTWYLKAHGRLLSPLTSDEPYKFNSKEEAVAFAKAKYKTNWQNIVPTTYDVPNSLANQPDSGWNEKNLKPVAEEEPEPKRKPAVVKTNKEIGTRVADIGPGGKEYNVKTNKAWDDEHKQEQGVAETKVGGNVLTDPSTATHTTHSTIWPNTSQERKLDPLHHRSEEAMRSHIKALKKKYGADNVSTKVKTNQGVAEAKADPVGSWVVYDGSKVKRFKSREGAKAYAEKNGGKVASSEFYADNIQGKQGVAEAGPFSYGKPPRKGSVADLAAKKRKEQEKGTQPVEPKDQMVGVAKVTKGVAEGSTWYAGNGAIKEKISKYEELALKANREGDDAKTKMYQQKIQTLKQKMSHMEESAGGMGAASVATSMGGGNGFANGGPGTISRPRMKKKK